MNSRNRHLTTQEILDALGNVQENSFPTAAIQAARERRQELIPHFRRAIDLALALAADEKLQDEGDWRLANFGLALLSEWQVPGTYERLMQIMLLPDELDRRWLIGSALYTDWPHLLLNTFPRGKEEEVQRLQNLVLDSEVDEDARSCVLRVLAGLAHHGIIARDRIVAWFQWLFECDLSTPMGFVVDELIFQSANLKDASLMERVRALYASGWTDDPTASLKEIEEMAQSPWPSGHSINCKVANPFTDVTPLIHQWDYFDRVDPTQLAKLMKLVGPGFPYGRAGLLISNPDPLCPCGSGRRYRHCCGR